ncbi:MAG: V4R domain-containing protein [Thermodesulfobacteriota bacterium]
MVENKILKNLSFNAEKGGLYFNEVRYLLIRPEVLVTFQKEVEEELGEKANIILFKSGFQGGMLSSKKFQSLYHFSNMETIHFMLEMGSQIGWGHFELERFDPVKRILSLKVYSSPFAETYGRSTEPVCHFIRGVMAGLTSFVFQKEVNASEVECHAKGDPSCKFEIMW